MYFNSVFLEVIRPAQCCTHCPTASLQCKPKPYNCTLHPLHCIHTCIYVYTRTDVINTHLIHQKSKSKFWTARIYHWFDKVIVILVNLLYNWFLIIKNSSWTFFLLSVEIGLRVLYMGWEGDFIPINSLPSRCIGTNIHIYYVPYIL